MMMPSPHDVATAIYQVAISRGVASPAEIEEQAGQLLATFALEHPEHPIAWFFDRASDLDVEAFFRALGARIVAENSATPARRARAGVARRIELTVWLN